ncbi:unnamed protein product [Heligmosomoides polygyrus]|uniref:Inhibitor_I29 domain-containing protein n=1 Tax=Heligmosomoides polygyrus TaxID=6339 RepID=A0A183F3W3_HELPZ|nr:unnamed protein product [Heligmosomoides polygyrus]
MIAILAALSFFFVAADGQFDVCRLDDEYKSVFEDFHRNARRLTWRDGIDQHAKEELLRPGSKTGEESPYIKVEGERHFAEDDQTPLTVKLSLALRKLIRGLARQVITVCVSISKPFPNFSRELLNSYACHYLPIIYSNCSSPT